MLCKSRFGFSIAFISVLAFVGVLVYRHLTTSPDSLAYVCTSAAVLGSVLWLSGQLVQNPRKKDEFSMGRSPEAVGNQEVPSGHWLSELTSLRHLGFVLIVSGVLVYCLVPKQRAEQSRVTVVASKPLEPSPPAQTPPRKAKSRLAKTNSPPPSAESAAPAAAQFPKPPAQTPPRKVKSRPAKTNSLSASAESAAPAAAEFPKLKLGGIIVNGANSTAVINGQVMRAGDRLGEVTVVAIEPRTVTVESSGKRLILHWDR